MPINISSVLLRVQVTEGVATVQMSWLESGAFKHREYPRHVFHAPHYMDCQEGLQGGTAE